MGLFDIFKRRSKKNEEKESKKSTEQAESKPNAEQTENESSDKATNENKTKENAATENTAKENANEAPANEASKATEKQTASQEESPVEPNSTEQAKETETAEPASETSNNQQVNESQSSEAENSQAAEGHDETSAKESSNETKATEAETEPADETTQAAENDESTTQQYEKGLEKSRSSFGEKLNALLANFRHVDETFFDNLEDMLIESDVGFETSMRITDELRDEVKLQNAKKPKDVQNVIVKKLIDMYDKAGNGENPAINMAKSGPTVILFVGVNGVGKTTTIGKMAKMYKDQGKKVVLAAADTFRAGAIEQLNVWAERDGVDIVKGKAKSDPASVVYDAVQKARDEQYDILMVDTAGRLQNKVNLMNELSKMKKILTREIPDAPHEVLLVLDATTGQNAMNQAKMFKEATDVTGIVLTKLDGTARGGIVLAIRSELHLPVKYVGLGEKVGDLRPFDPNDFVYGLFKGLISE
ncbi:signal recognition particle-docking protein FtsY [Lentilactobacillus kefiri]|uniref:Signal recognition particle receptor FtsY n=2 Tax=Bacilli TaxID=91061 RepID=A0A511DVW3_LENKE|nr:signal recognition particle-docking protein FtsY [Lentilactobacillus kefiri]GEL28980.1 signal recognition particle receptor FtsY [Lentilactobacillus kefiri]